VLMTHPITNYNMLAGGLANLYALLRRDGVCVALLRLPMCLVGGVLDWRRSLSAAQSILGSFVKALVDAVVGTCRPVILVQCRWVFYLHCLGCWE
jgi:hypothetical protein